MYRRGVEPQQISTPLHTSCESLVMIEKDNFCLYIVFLGPSLFVLG